ALQIESPRALFVGEPAHFPLALASFEAPKIYQRQGSDARALRLLNDLRGVVADHGESGPQHRVPPQQFGKRIVERRHIELAVKLYRGRDVVGSRLRLKLI